MESSKAAPKPWFSKRLLYLLQEIINIPELPECIWNDDSTLTAGIESTLSFRFQTIMLVKLIRTRNDPACLTARLIHGVFYSLLKVYQLLQIINKICLIG